MICGTTPNAIDWDHEPPVARMASSCVGSMSSMSSARSLPRKPILANASVRTPASGPNPTMTTKMMAMTISCRERETAITARQKR